MRSWVTLLEESYEKIKEFTSLASGGAVIISQYIGKKENEYGNKSASQLVRPLISEVSWWKMASCRQSYKSESKSWMATKWDNTRNNYYQLS